MATFHLAAEVLETETEAVVETNDSPPNPVLPTGNEIFWSAVFFLLFWLLMKYVLLPPIRAVQKRRAQELESSKDTVDSLEGEKDKLLNDYEAALTAVHQEASKTIETARQRAEEYRSGVMTKAEAEVAEFRAKNDAELEQARQVAIVSLQGDVETLTSQAVETILGIAPDKKLITKHIEQLEV